MKIKVTTEEGTKTIVGTEEDLGRIKAELQGLNISVGEYKTDEGEIITDWDIIGFAD